MNREAALHEDTVALELVKPILARMPSAAASGERPWPISLVPIKTRPNRTSRHGSNRGLPDSSARRPCRALRVRTFKAIRAKLDPHGRLLRRWLSISV
jgi:hypothetical protein